jgi:C4-dicarboxylate transporter DctM subunit
MFMAGISGSAAADAAATGSLLIPAMVSRGYPRPFAAALLAAAATIGPVIPPSIPMVVYGTMGGVSVGRLFVGGVVPGVLMGIFLMVAAYLAARRHGYGAREAPVGWGQALRAIRGAAFPMLVPLIIIGGILGGIFTATESAGVAVMTVLLIGAVLFRQISLSDLIASLRGAVRVLGPIMLIISAASVFGLLLTQERAGEHLTSLLTIVSREPLAVLATFSAIVLILGCFMDAMAILILLTPVAAPLMPRLGIDPVHFGLVFIVALMIGLTTPPVGLTMYIGLSIAKISMEQFTRAFWPFLIALLVVLALIIVFPPLVVFLPNVLMPVK